MTIMSSEVSERAVEQCPTCNGDGPEFCSDGFHAPQDVETRARELLAAEYAKERMTLACEGPDAIDGTWIFRRDKASLRAIEAALSAPPIDDELVAWLRYHVNNPSAWQNYDEAVSELIRQAADRIAAAGEVRRRTIEECAAICEGFDDFDYVQLPVGHDRWEPGSPYDRGAEAAAKKLAQAIRSLSAKEDDNA